MGKGSRSHTSPFPLLYVDGESNFCKRFVESLRIPDMTCSACSTDTVTFAVPDEYASALPGDEPAAGLCTQCLQLEPVSEPPAHEPEFQRISDAFPTDPAAALPMALLIGLLSNLALYRSEISSLLEAVERHGTDPLLVLDRLSHDETIESQLDLAGRRRQLEQLL